MYPSALVAGSLVRGLDVIGICDHNASENVRYVIRAAKKKPLTVLPGIEVTSREEVHIIGLFEKIESLYEMQDIVYKFLPGVNNEKIFGCQAIVNDKDEVEGFNEKLLIGATNLSLREITEAIQDLKGIAIAAHVDRESFGLFGQLGFVPDDVHFDALEISFRSDVRRIATEFPELAGHCIIRSSDAHGIAEIGRATTTIKLREPSVAELKLAFKNRNGRRIVQ
jgi:PHP family Zn ribbon phosphoesterase